MRQLLFSFDGRISRGRFWIGNLMLLSGFAVFLLCAVLVAALSTKSGEAVKAPAVAATLLIGLLFLVYIGLAIWAGVCLGIKRFHDRDKPGIWVCIQFVPFIGGLWYLIETGFLPGTSGPNIYGPDSLDPESPSGDTISSAIPSPFGTRPSIDPTAPVAWPATIAPRQATGSRPAWVLPTMLALTLPGAAILAGGLALGWQTSHWMQTAIQVSGTVTALEPGNSNDNGTKSFKAVVAAKTLEGVPFQITDFWAISPAPKIGSTRALAYQPGRQDEAVILGFLRQYWPALVLDTIGGSIMIGWLLITLLVALLWERGPRQGARV